MNAMTQVISLSENFISDILGGDSFLVGLTANGDVFFVDDSLESVQINTQPIETIAICGTKLFGTGRQNNLFQWSTDNLNKLSFNKENQMLMRQDFQTREFKLAPAVSQKVSLFCSSLLKTQVALVFEDMAGEATKFRIQNQEMPDDIEKNLTQN
jgi:hypothetical protein